MATRAQIDPPAEPAPPAPSPLLEAGGPMPATITQTRELARRTDEELLDTYYGERDLAARDELVDRFMPFARKLAVRYMHSREPLDDLVQVACIGLLNAIDRFDPEHGKKFTAFAAPTILGELKRYFRDKGWAIHVPRDLQERVLAVSRHAERLSVQLRRSPTIDELAARARLHGRADSRGDRRGQELRADLARRARRPRRRRRVRTHGNAGGRGRRVRTCRRPTGAREQLGGANRAGTPSTRPAARAWSHAARDQPADRLFANARLPSTA